MKFTLIRLYFFLMLILPTSYSQYIKGDTKFLFSVKDLQSFGFEFIFHGVFSSEVRRAAAANVGVSLVSENSSKVNLPLSVSPTAKTANIWELNNIHGVNSTIAQIEHLIRHSKSHISSVFFVVTEILPPLLAEVVLSLKWDIPISSHVYFIHRNGSFYFNLLTDCIEYYRIKYKTVVQNVGSLIQEQSEFHPKEFTWVHLLQSSARRGNLQKIPIIGVARPNANYAEYNDDLPYRKFTGGVIVLQYWNLRDALNFSEGAIISDSVREGPNGTLTGYAVQINSGEADICVSRTEFLIFRMRGPDGIAYLHPFTTSRMKAFFKQPPASSIRDVYRDAFSTDAWCGLFLTWTLLAVSFSVISRIHRICSLYARLSETFSWVAASVSLQGNTVEVSWESVKLVATVGSLLGLFCFNLYSSTLVALFSTEAKPVRSLGDLISQGFFIYSDYYFPTAKFRALALQDAGLIPKVPEEVRNVDPSQKLSELFKSKAAVISIHDGFHSAVEKNGVSGSDICKIFSTVDLSNERLRMSMFVKKGSPFRNIFNVKTLSMIERGVTFREYEAHYKTIEVNCKRERNFEAPQLGLKDVFSAYIFLLMFASFSLILACAERCYGWLSVSKLSQVKEIK